MTDTTPMGQGTPGHRASGVPGAPQYPDGSGSTTVTRPMPPRTTPPGEEVVPLYGPEFAADPYGVYERLRRFGSLAPVEIAPGVGAMLVIDYRAALELLHDPATWSKDSSAWTKSVPPDSQVLPMLGWRPNALVNDGEVHRRFRSVISDSWARIDSHDLREQVRQVAETLITQFATKGSADLIAEYARRLPLLLYNNLFGMPESQGDRLVAAIGGLLESRDPEEAARSLADFESYIMETIESKKRRPGADLTSWFMEHPAELTEEEVLHQLVLTMAAGHEPTTNLIGNALARMLSDDRYYGTLSSGGLTPRDAIQDVLLNEPPMSNFSPHFPTRDIFFHGTWIRAGQLVLVSYAAAAAQHGRTPPGRAGGTHTSGGGAHLAWAAGPHACPVQQPALLVATTAIERLTAWLSDIELTVPHEQLVWRHGPFHRALAELPARFTPITPDQAGVTPWSSRQSSSTPQDATSTVNTGASASSGR